MSTTFAAQLREITARSTNELDLKAQKASHAESLIFEKKIAGSQDIETIYQICLEGYQELCYLDSRFRHFEQNIFSPQSRNQDRTRMNAQENEALDDVLEYFLQLVGGRLLLRPAVKAVEWLIRRFKIHTYNTAVTLTTFLPYHETPLFRNLLSILPDQLPSEHKYLSPYLTTATNPPRSAIVYTATTSDAFFSALNSYVLSTAQNGCSHSALLAFWSHVATEAVTGRLHSAQSGRKEVQRQRQEDLLLKILPTLSEGLAIRGVPELTMSCYTITMILASKGMLSESALDSLIQAVAVSTTSTDPGPALVCLTVLCQQKTENRLPQDVAKSLTKTPMLDKCLQDLSARYPVEQLIRMWVGSLLTDFKKHNITSNTETIESALRTALHIVDPSNANLLIIDVIQNIWALDQQDPVSVAIRAHLVDVISRLRDAQEFQTVITNAIASSGLDIEVLERIFGNFAEQAEEVAPSEEDSNMSLDQGVQFISAAETLSHLPERTVDQHTFLLNCETYLFQQLKLAFQECCTSPEALSRFESLPIWNSADSGPVLMLSLLLRIAAGTDKPRVRSAALRLIARQIVQNSKYDMRGLIPYMCVFLRDPAQVIRKNASQIVKDISDSLGQQIAQGGVNFEFEQLSLYETANVVDSAGSTTPSQIIKMVQRVFIPVLEECVLDSHQIDDTIQHALGSDSTPRRASQNTINMELKKGERSDLFNLLAIHLLATPLVRVKLGLIEILSGIDKVGSISKTKMLMPILEDWVNIGDGESISKAEAEGLELNKIDSSMMMIVSSRNIQALTHLLNKMVENQLQPRGSLVEKILDRVIQLWRELKASDQVSLSRRLFELALKNSSDVAREAQNALNHVELPTAALISILQLSRDGFDNMRDTPPPRKRRRTSRGQSGSFSSNARQAFQSLIGSISIALELVDGSTPEKHLEILPELFETLAVVQNLQKYTQAQLSYVLRMCLGSMLAIVNNYRPSNAAKIDISVIRADLIAECIRSSENPQVQNTALLLTATLAEINPSHVLHHIMPIFTFMGATVLSKNDDHSVHVVNETLDRIIPSVVAAVRLRSSTDVIEQTADLLSSFTAAYDHIPPHRRLNLFQRLLSRLGVEEYSFAVIGMLATKFSSNNQVQEFCTAVMDCFDTIAQLSTFRGILDVVRDLFTTYSRRAQIVAGLPETNSSEATVEAAQNLLSVAAHLLKSRTLKDATQNLSTLDEETSSVVRETWQAGFVEILDFNQTIGPELRPLVNECLNAYLTLTALDEYIDSLPDALRAIDHNLRPSVLLALQSRLNSHSIKDSRTQGAAIDFLSTLTELVTSTEEKPDLKVVAVACIDRIVDLYGRKDITSVTKATSALIRRGIADSSEDRVKVAILLCLASVLEVVREGVIPLLQDLFRVMFQTLEQSLVEDEEKPALHNASFALLTGIITHVSFMISDQVLDHILELCADSANSELDAEGRATRQEFLRLASKKIELKPLVNSITRTWSRIVENDVVAVDEMLSLLGSCLEASSKSTVIKSADEMSWCILKCADLRRIQFTIRTPDGYSEDDVVQVETKLNEVVMKFIYKLNDNVFRPLFSQWVEWAVQCSDLDSAAAMSTSKLLRETTLFNLLAHFFVVLKSIVTSYTTYILDPAVDILKEALEPSENTPTQLNEDAITRYLATLSVLTAAAQYDQDSFFASPAHFSLYAESLASNLTLASRSHRFRQIVTTHLIPCIVSLAMATIDSPSSQQQLNRLLCRPSLRQHDHPAVRLALVHAQIALSQDPELGSDWIENAAREGETMVCVNEMLEDDDDEVEGEVRRWVRLVRDRVGGEDVFGV